MNNNKFFIEDGYLSIRFTENFVQKYIYLESCSDHIIQNILETLNSNIKNIKISENPFEKEFSILINNKEYIKTILNEDETQQLFIFYLEKLV